jgi:hypothetical protein
MFLVRRSDLREDLGVRRRERPVEDLLGHPRGLISGRLGGLYERLAPSRFWLLHAVIVAAGGVLLLLLAPQLRRALIRIPVRQP